jgi:hypothetical protein
MRDKIITTLTSLTSLSSIEVLNKVNIPDLFKFAGESIIGVLTIIYLILKIKKLYHEKNNQTTDIYRFND